MTPISPETPTLAISLPITSAMRQTAEQFAIGQPNSQKAEQILLNTIAVSIVNNYLEMLGIATDLSASDSWNPVMQLCGDSADLVISEIGTLECRPVKSNASSCQIPGEVWDLRIGYTVVAIDESLKEAQILGFVSQITTEELPLNALQPPEALIDRIHQLQESTANNSVINLSQWFEHIFATGWQSVASLFRPEQLTPALAFRSNSESADSPADTSITRVKEINLGVQLGDRKVILLVKLVPEGSGIGVTLQVHPSAARLYLPEALMLRVLEESDAVFLEAQARSQDNFIQLQFSGQPTERFTVEIMVDEARFTEQFQL